MLGNPLLLGDGGYQISRSVRLRSSATAYFNRTPASAGNRNTWTWSGWSKRGALGSGAIFHSLGAGGFGVEGFVGFASDTIDFIFDYNGGSRWRLTTTPVYRDPSAWYHIVFVADTTNATSGDRLRLYVNGTRITAFSTANYPTQNANGTLNQAYSHAIGARTTPSDYLDGYLTEVNFIDGQALTPSSFGETDAITGVWKPRRYTGTYGTNGFFLNFSDPSAATAAAIGKDYSGNGNNWTPNNVSVTAGATYDSMLDVPTTWADGGNGRGNYAVLNRLDSPSPSGISEGNLTWYSAVAAWQTTRATMAVSSGKWYWEVLCSNLTANSTYMMLGVDNFTVTIASGYPGASSSSYGYFSNDGNKYNNGAAAAYGASYVSNDIIGVAFDLDAGTLTFYKNGVSQGTAYTGISGTYVPAFGEYGSILNANFGQRPFAYTPPTGFRALNTQNLPEPTIKKGNQYFDVGLYTGDGVNGKSVVTGLSFTPDLAWGKTRSTTGDHAVVDAVRGNYQTIFTNLTQAETSQNTYALNVANSLYAANAMNVNGTTYSAWMWKEGATQGFDIVTYTGNGTSQNIAHSLGVAPRMMIVKARSAINDWAVYHASLPTPATQALFLNLTIAAQSGVSAWNSTAPTSSVFSLGASSAVNASAQTFVAYLFSEVAGFSRFGSYTGNGSADGPFVFCGFRPRWVMIKRTDSAVDWQMYDTARGTVNVINATLAANLSSAESAFASGYDIDFLSNGFKPRSGPSNAINTSGGTYIFAAFAENPFRYALAR